MFSKLGLDGLDKWSLDPRFQVEMVFVGTHLKPYIVCKFQGVALVMLRSSKGVEVE
jgi:hypothetical protein